ncbi:MAG TPA: BatA and WFA domain-containing protein [Terrimicrobiaceae bacterium]|nr:BatA and WFA domain-containing protein [Terrimicrobiaceae bacterium]
MNFLLPAALWLGALAAPIIALYLLKSRQRRRSVSTLLFWEQIKPRVENSPLWRKLRRWISLAIQLLILGLVIAALARPAFEWEQSSARHVVAVIDPSASMQADHPLPSRWENARTGLLRAIDRLRPNDEMAILTAEDPPRILSGWSSSQRLLRDALKPAAPLPTGTNPAAAFLLAKELVATRDTAAIEIFSDSVWPAGGGTKPDPDTVIRGIDPTPASNAGITHFAVRRSPVTPGDWQLDAEIESPQAFSGTLEVSRDGQPMDVVEVHAGPGSPWGKAWRGNAESGSSFSAALRPGNGDMLAADNRAGCELRALDPLRVILTGSEDPYLTALFGAVPLVEWVVMPKFPDPVPEDIDLIIAGDGALPDAPPAVPVLLVNPSRDGFWGKRTGQLSDAPLTEIAETSPLLRHAALAQVAVTGATQWTPPDGAEVLVSSLGHPLLFGQWDRNPRWLVIGFTPANSDLPLRTAFPVLIGNLLQSLREDPAGLQGAAVLPGPTETLLAPTVAASSEPERHSTLPNVPGWWLALLAGLVILTAEWFTYNRRITD